MHIGRSISNDSFMIRHARSVRRVCSINHTQPLPKDNRHPQLSSMIVIELISRMNSRNRLNDCVIPRSISTLSMWSVQARRKHRCTSFTLVRWLILSLTVTRVVCSSSLSPTSFVVRSSCTAYRISVLMIRPASSCTMSLLPLQRCHRPPTVLHRLLHPPPRLIRSHPRIR